MSAFFPIVFVEKNDGTFTGTGIQKIISPQNSGGAFEIRVEPEKCVITADRDGIFYAEDLLREFNGAIPCGIIREIPSTAIRCFHIDMKKGIGSLENLKRTVIRLRELRINFILAEYENRIRYNCAPEIAESDALSQNQVREFVGFAEANGIHVIPLLQCLGHMEYLLSVEKYRHLSETPDSVTQYCPLDERSLTLFKQMAEELLALHPDAEYFHVGGDETRELGKCPECAEFVRRHSAPELYFQRLNAVCRWFDGHGRKTLFWHDMLSHAGRYDLIGQLPESAFPMYWSYGGNDDVDTRFYLDGTEGVTISGKWAERIDSFAGFEEVPKAFSHISDELPLRNTRFDGLAELCRVRREVWGASGIIRAGLFPNELIVRENISNWCEAAEEFRMRGIVITCWAAIDSHSVASGPRSLCHNAVALEGMKLWDHTLSIEELRRRYDNYYGTPELTRILNIMVFTKPHELFCNWGEYGGELAEKLTPSANGDLLEKYRAAILAEKLFRQTDSFLRFAAKSMFSPVEPAKQRVLVQLEEYRRKLAESKAALAVLFSDEYAPQTLDEWLNSHYGPRLVEIDGYLSYYARTHSCSEMKDER